MLREVDKFDFKCVKCEREFVGVYRHPIKATGPGVMPQVYTTSSLKYNEVIVRDGNGIYKSNCPKCDYDNFYDKETLKPV